MSNAIAKESHAGARDNVVGAIARLIIANYSGLPLDQIFPVFVNQLPLKEDFEENKTVFKSILTLYQAGHSILQPHMQLLLKVAVSVLHEERAIDDGTWFYRIKIITADVLELAFTFRFCRGKGLRYGIHQVRAARLSKRVELHVH